MSSPETPAPPSGEAPPPPMPMPGPPTEWPEPTGILTGEDLKLVTGPPKPPAA